MYQSPVGCFAIGGFALGTVILLGASAVSFMGGNGSQAGVYLFGAVIAGMCTIGLAKAG